MLEDLYRDPERVVVTAHRGFSGRYPENTLLAFARAAELGVDIIEFDLRGTRERVPVVIHDPTVERTSNGEGPVGELTLGALKRLDFSGGGGHGQEIPTFEEALAEIPTSVGLNIQVKETDQRLLQSICGAFAGHGLYGRAYLTVSTFADAARVRALDPDIALCILERSRPLHEDLMLGMLEAGARFFQPHRRDVTPPLCAIIRRLGLRANMFYSNTDEDNRKYIGWGIRGILTDRPDILLETIAGLS
jgi:glycerophosphoryl diester phosphodiesterase